MSLDIQKAPDVVVPVPKVNWTQIGQTVAALKVGEGTRVQPKTYCSSFSLLRFAEGALPGNRKFSTRKVGDEYWLVRIK